MLHLFDCYKIFPMEMINPNPSPTWRMEFGLSWIGTSVHNDSPANPHESRLLGNRQTHFTILNTFEGDAGTITSAYFMPIT